MFPWLLGLCLILGLWGAGCAPAVSPSFHQAASASAASVGFSELAAHPEQYKGQVKVLGGEVMTLQPWGKDGSLMAVDQQDLNRYLFPAGTAHGGTFLVASDQWLSPGKYQPKSKVTVVGVVEGQKDGYPLLKLREIRFWEGPVWEKWYYPLPREWYNYDPALEYWYTPPYFDPWRGGGGRF